MTQPGQHDPPGLDSVYCSQYSDVKHYLIKAWFQWFHKLGVFGRYLEPPCKNASLILGYKCCVMSPSLGPSENGLWSLFHLVIRDAGFKVPTFCEFFRYDMGLDASSSSPNCPCPKSGESPVGFVGFLNCENTYLVDMWHIYRYHLYNSQPDVNLLLVCEEHHIWALCLFRLI